MLESPSVHDLLGENSVHMLLTGLLFGIPGYANPVSNREEGRGYYDLRLEPLELKASSPEAHYAAATRPLITIEVKFSKVGKTNDARLLAEQALLQIEERGYDTAPLPEAASGRLRWGIAFCGKEVVARCARA